MLDAAGIVKLAGGDRQARRHYEAARDRESHVVTAASTIAEVLRGGPSDARLHRVLSRVTVVPIDKGLGRTAGELLVRVGITGHRCTIDALLAAVALGLPRPVVLLTSDPDDMARLTEEPGRPQAERIAVLRV